MANSKKRPHGRPLDPGSLRQTGKRIVVRTDPADLAKYRAAAARGRHVLRCRRPIGGRLGGGVDEAAAGALMRENAERPGYTASMNESNVIAEPGRGAGWLPRPVWLLVGTVLFVVVGVGFRFGWPIYRQQAAIRAIEAVGGRVGTDKAGPDWLRGLVGDERMRPLDSVGFFDLSSTQVTDAGLLNLAGLTKLEGLGLTGTQITDAGLVHLVGLRNLESLDLCGTQVTDAGLVHVAGLTNLKWLYLRETQVTDAGLLNLTGLTKLEWLSLTGTQVTDAGLVHLAGLTNLEVLVLIETEITDAGLVHLAGLANLEWLFLGGTQVTDLGVDELKRAIPGLEVER